MKQLLYLVMSLVVIAAIIPVTSAYVGGQATVIPTVVGDTSVTVLTNPYSSMDAAGRTAVCQGYWPGSSYYDNGLGWYSNTSYYNTSYSPGDVWIDPSQILLLPDYGTIGYTAGLSSKTIFAVNSTGGFVKIGCTLGGNRLTFVDQLIIRSSSMGSKPVTFTGTPISGAAPTETKFTLENSTFADLTRGVIWAFGDGQIVNSTATTINHTYQNEGIYTVSSEYTKKYEGNPKITFTRINYITVGVPNATATTHAVARDLYTGFAINGAQVDMYDVENISWTNTTAINGEGSITTLLGHTINIWGSATGYEDDNLQGVPAVDGGYYSLLLRPTNLTTYNSTPGNLTLAVTVQDLQIPHQTLSGAEVTAAWGAQYASGTSNAAGSVFFTVPNNTAIHLSAFKSGYASGSSTHITGTTNGGSTMETAIVYIGTDYVTPVPSVTATTGPGGTVPQTVDPYPCIGDGSPADTANCQRKQGSMAADLISYGPDLVKFFIMLTFIGGIMLLNKR